MGAGAETERTRVGPPWPEDVRTGEPPWIPLGRPEHHHDLIARSDRHTFEGPLAVPPTTGLLDRSVIPQHLLDDGRRRERPCHQGLRFGPVIQPESQALAPQDRGALAAGN